jgi:hypothetical protein
VPYRDKPFLWLLAATAVLGIAFDTVYSTLGNYLRDYYHLSTEAIGWQFGLNALLVIALQIPLSHWGERWGMRRQMLLGSVLLACGLGMLPFGSGLFYVCLSTLIWTLGEAFFMPPLNVLAMRFAQAGKSGQYFRPVLYELERQCAVVAGAQWPVVRSIRWPQCVAGECADGVDFHAADLASHARAPGRLADPAIGVIRKQSVCEGISARSLASYLVNPMDRN